FLRPLGLRLLPTPLATAATGAGRALLGADTMPAYHPGLPGGGDRRRPRPAERPAAVYLPSCTGAVFGPGDGDGGDGVTAAFLELCDRAGVQVTVPEGVDAMCCGTPWKSKGHERGHRRMAELVRPALWAATRQGELPVVSDAASCTEGLAGLLDELPGPVRVVDAVAFVHETLLDRLTVTAPLPSLALHPTCSTARLGIDDALAAVARRIADDVHVPTDWGCCAFAGDRGLLHPELTAAATAPEAAELAGRDFAAHASANRTCELGMSRATGHDYRHLLELLARATRPTR
ncbi:heterodisulfide reductase-related iron-sulfur binding cluster, partial [Streptomyces mayteni]